MDSSKKVVFTIVEHVVAHRHTWGDELGDATLHHLVHLGESLLSLELFALLLGVFELVADGYALAGSDEFGQIGIEGMMGEACHLHAARLAAVVTAREGDAQYARGGDGVFAVGLVEVAAAEEHQRLRVLGLEGEELLHHRGEPLVVFCHSGYLTTEVTGLRSPFMLTRNALAAPNLRNMSRRTGMWFLSSET